MERNNLEGHRETVVSVVEKITRIRREEAGGAEASEEEQDKGIADEGHHLLDLHLQSTDDLALKFYRDRGVLGGGVDGTG